MTEPSEIATKKSRNRGNRIGHPGQFVRDSALTPNKMSVAAAARVVGVGRPAFSNFLNGNAATTPEMAARIERAFGISARELLAMQAAHDAAQAEKKGAPVTSKSYVPPHLQIQANDVEEWASNSIIARSRVAILLRTLVNSTGPDLTRVDFPGNDDAERPGWDGYVEAIQGTPWIPAGASGWEFGVNVNIKQKADKDFAKSVRALSLDERKEITFVFVTPRRWNKKLAWVREQNEKALWKDVRAYDSSDLEQWIEQSIAAQTWLANETKRPSKGVRTLEKCWSDWANVTTPPLIGKFFDSSVAQAKEGIGSHLAKKPVRPFVVTGDSIEEALAFLAQLFGSEDLQHYRDRVLVFDEPGTLPKLATGLASFIAVATSREVERELGPLSRSMHTIAVYPRNAANADPNVVLQPLSFEEFRTSLEAMDYSRDEVGKLSSESGQSLTVLRRRLAKVDAIHTPEWAYDHGTAASLVPFLLAGAWSATNQDDTTVVSLLANAKPYETLEKEFLSLSTLNDAPVWSAGTIRGVISQIDLLFAISHAISADDLQRFFDVAEIVLGEDDPKLDLPDDKRWAAALYGKSRPFSGSLRRSISGTLVLLAVYGNQLFHSRIGFDCEWKSAKLVERILAPLTTRKLEANDLELPVYAEAAPDKFLTILEEDFKGTQPQSYGLMRPADPSVFGGGCHRSGLLWALENLAWNPLTLPRASLILAQLAEIQIEDNWVNKPINSLKSIFRAWMPQTAAGHEERVKVMRLLAKKFPQVAWQICVGEFGSGEQYGHYSHKPTWRPDAYGHGEPFSTWGPIRAFVREMVDMALSWEELSREMLCDLIERLHDLSDADQTKVWALVTRWAASGIAESDRAFVREKIRVSVLSRRAARKKNDSPNLSTSAKAAYAALEPRDVLQLHAWLFREDWVDESADELEDDTYDHREREERIANLRTDALREILEKEGLKGILKFAEMGKASSQIGWLLASRIFSRTELTEFICKAVSSEPDKDTWTRKNLLTGAVRSIRDDIERTKILEEVGRNLSDAEFISLLQLAPFRRSTWKIIDSFEGSARKKYWEEVSPDWIPEADDENNEAVERLIAVDRPRAAFACVHFTLEKITPDLLFKLMSEILQDGKDQLGQYQLDQYYIEQAFILMDKNAGLTVEQKASLEFAYIDALSQPWRDDEKTYGVPNLEKFIERHPEFFVQAVVWTYKRRTGGEDPKEWKVPSEKVQHFAARGHKLLDALVRIPCCEEAEDQRAPSLRKWIDEVRESCRELDRLGVADICIGKLLAHAPVGTDGVWPCEPVREVMEDIQSKSMMEGAHTGLYNSRGVAWRGVGGQQERDLAAKYRGWANALQYSHPFVASELLSGMVKTYEHEAGREDLEADIRRRLPY